ncbi:hypothetical protein GCM10010149_67530 [Nonomuraea roseoviolacea subsp. roseoviolacea]
MSAKALAFAAFLLIGSGILTGLLPVTSGGEACGSAFVEGKTGESPSAYGSFLEQNRAAGCDDVRNLVRIPAIVLMAAGGATLCAAGATRWRISLTRS